MIGRWLSRVAWSSVVLWSAASFAVAGTWRGGLMGTALFLALGLIGAVR